MLLIIWHISIGYLIASNLAILMSGRYVTGIVEEQITSQQICGRHKDRTCTDYDAMIHYTFDGRGHAFKSDAIGQAAIGSKFGVIVVPDDPHKASTVIGTILASIGMLWQVCIGYPYTPSYIKKSDDTLDHPSSRNHINVGCLPGQSLWQLHFGLLLQYFSIFKKIFESSGLWQFLSYLWSSVGGLKQSKIKNSHKFIGEESKIDGYCMRNIVALKKKKKGSKFCAYSCEYFLTLLIWSSPPPCDMHLLPDDTIHCHHLYRDMSLEEAFKLPIDFLSVHEFDV